MHDSAVARVAFVGGELGHRGFGDVVGAFADDQAAESLVDQLGGGLDHAAGFVFGRARGTDAEADGRVMGGDADFGNPAAGRQVHRLGFDLRLPLAEQVDLAMDGHPADPTVLA